MPFFRKTKIFIFPDRSKLLLLRSDGLSYSDVDGSNEVYITEGDYYSNYIYNGNTGFIYFIRLDSGDIYRNQYDYDFTSFISFNNFFIGNAFNNGGHMVLANNGRIIFGYGPYLRYTDDFFNSSVDISILPLSYLYFLIYEGGNNILSCIYNNTSSLFEFYRSIDNGSTWQSQPVPFGINSFQDGCTLNI
ncbi:MAG TPA: hypothetical protein P5513_07360 [Candidatus Diapherotrites archaeon]|nr:hypothetical protein [Candidatus Diapherotrites archaeon]